MLQPTRHDDQNALTVFTHVAGLLVPRLGTVVRSPRADKLMVGADELDTLALRARPGRAVQRVGRQVRHYLLCACNITVTER